MQLRQNTIEISGLKADLDAKFREVYDMKSAALASLLVSASPASVSSPLRASLLAASGTQDALESNELPALRARVQSLAASLADKEAQFEVLAHHQSLAEVCACGLFAVLRLACHLGLPAEQTQVVRAQPRCCRKAIGRIL